jgi:hypothetical protein
MFAYHLRRVRYPRLLFVLLVVAAFVWLGFRPGGTELGDTFGLRGAARYWALLTPIVVLLVTPMLDGLWDDARLQRNWRLAQVGAGRARIDRYLNFLTGFAVCVGVLLTCAGYAAVRLQPGAVSYLNLATVLLVGPIAGVYSTLLAAYAVGWTTASGPARFAVVAGAALLDITNQLPTPLLSLSGTTRVAAGHGAWSPLLDGSELDAVVAPTTWYWVCRLGGCVVLTVIVLAMRPANRRGVAGHGA